MDGDKLIDLRSMVNLQFKNAAKLPNNIHIRLDKASGLAMTQKSSALPRLAHNEKRVAELARTGERADKVKKLKEQIAADQFQVDSKEVAKSIARSEVQPGHSTAVCLSALTLLSKMGLFSQPYEPIPRPKSPSLV